MKRNLTEKSVLVALAGLCISFVCASTCGAQGGEEESLPVEVRVATATVIRATLRGRITAYGVIEPEPAGEGRPAALARLSPAVPGIVAEARGVEGQKVSQGEILFRLDSRAAEAALAKAETAVKFAARNAERQKILMASGDTSEKLLLEAQQTLAGAEADLAEARVNLSLRRGEAPFPGTLTRFSARPGEAADAGTVLAEIVDLDRLVAAVRVDGASASGIKAGQSALLRVSTEAAPVPATVSFISPVVDPATGGVAARLALSKESGLSPGQFVAAAIIVEEKPGCLAVPRDAVFTNPEGQSTLSVVTGGVARRIAVKAGLSDGDLVEVAGDGVTEGATVVTTGSYALPDETPVRSATP